MGSLAQRRAKAGAGHTALTATGSLSKMNERPRDVSLKDITLDLGLQFRLDVKGTGGIDEKHVLDLMHVIADGADTDPVILYRVEDALLMVDGFHRYEAYRRSERPTLPAIVRDGTYAEAEEAAENANLQFKKALGDESKKYIFARRVQRGYQTNGISWNNLSDKAIAAELGVSSPTINTWFSELISGVKFFTPAGQEISIQVSLDRSKVYGRDGKEYEVQAMRDVMSKRADEQRERRAVEDAERKRNMPAVEKLRIITQHLVAKYRDAYAKRGNPLFDDPNKGYKWCLQVSNPVFVIGIDWENQFLHEYGAKPAGLYREFVRLIDQATFTTADMDGWTDAQMADYVYAMKQRLPRQPNATQPETFERTGMAQPKNPHLEVPQPKVLGRHRPEVAATEESAEDIPPCPFSAGQWVKLADNENTGKVKDTRFIDGGWQVLADIHMIDRWYWAKELVDATPAVEIETAPFYEGQQLWIVETGELDTVYKIEWVENEWRIWLENGEDFNRVHELSDVRPMGAAEAAILEEMTADLDDEQEDWEVNTNPKPCKFQKDDTVIYRPSKMQCRVLATKWNGQWWYLHVVDTNGNDFYESEGQFDLVATVVEDQAVVPFRVGDMVKDLESGELAEVLGFNSEGVVTVEGEDLDGKKYQYEVWAYDLEKVQADPKLLAQASSNPKPSNGKRQAEIMVEDARSIIPRLLMDSTHAAVDFRSGTLVRWESPKSIETILANADDKELKLLLREAERFITEMTAVQKGIQRAVNHAQDIVRQIQAARQSA